VNSLRSGGGYPTHSAGKQSYNPNNIEIGPKTSAISESSGGYTPFISGASVSNGLDLDPSLKVESDKVDSTGLSDKGASAISSGINATASLISGISEINQNEGLQQQAIQQAEQNRTSELNMQETQGRMEDSKVSMGEAGLDMIKMQNTFANRMKNVRKQIDKEVKKKNEIKMFGDSMKNKWDADEGYKDMMHNVFKGGEA
jgi:hypothetical protein